MGVKKADQRRMDELRVEVGVKENVKMKNRTNLTPVDRGSKRRTTTICNLTLVY